MTAKMIKPGDRITWQHYPINGEPVTREGTVWSGAPTGNGLSNAWWVHPDSYLPGELTAGGVIAIGRCSRSRATWYREISPRKGEIYGSESWDLQAGSLTAAGASWHARAARERDLASYEHNGLTRAERALRYAA